MEEIIITEQEIDTIGEIMNISMGASATAVSAMLERQVVITTPQIEVNKYDNIDYSYLEPAIVVKINYVEGLNGSNVIMLRRDDMRIILELLMKSDFSEMDEDFEFDDMSMSAACEVMNQMMGSSATALSELLGVPVNISTPQATLVDTSEEAHEIIKDLDVNDVMSISFNMTIKDTLDTKFSSIMPLDFVKRLVETLHDEITETPQAEPQPAPQQVPQAVQQPIPQAEPQPTPQAVPQPTPQAAPQPTLQQAPQFTPQPIPQQAPQAAQYQAPYPPQMPDQLQNNFQNFQQPYPPQMDYSYQQMQTPYGTEHYPPYQGAYQQPNPNIRYTAPMVSVKQADFPEFDVSGKLNAQMNPHNISVLMGVQLDVSVIVGRAKHKIKDILDFGQGSVIELDKQTGSPAEIMVNGKLLAYGDVVVVGDNFGVRITEIVGTKELIDSLDTKK